MDGDDRQYLENELWSLRSKLDDLQRDVWSLERNFGNALQEIRNEIRDKSYSTE